ncbi:MAG: hypothetical protein R3B47_04105 [Bacteroidia bacterium]
MPRIFTGFSRSSGTTLFTNRITSLSNVNPPIKLGPLNRLTPQRHGSS